MPSKHDWAIHHVSAAGLLGSVAFGHNPSASVAALALLVAYRLLDRYLHNSFYDEHDRAIKQLTLDVGKVKAKQDQNGLKAAFGGSSGQG